MISEGIIKYNCIFTQADFVVNDEILFRFNDCRKVLSERKWIGEYAEGLGFGNISIRTEKGFFITGSGTGGFTVLTKEHIAWVTKCDVDSNTVWCKGPLQASSESMTHSALYAMDPEIKAVIHIHDLKLWDNLAGKVPETSEKIEYETPEMAHEMERLYVQTNVKNEKIIRMAGHSEGIFVFSSDLNEALKILFRYK
ncbi:MAG: class II aldolase/adducin family protein [Bacteroidota bacterium]